MHKLKIWLQLGSLLIVFCYIGVILLSGQTNSIYDENTNEIKGIIQELDWQENRLQLTLQREEKIIAYKYYENDFVEQTLKKRYQLGDVVFLTGEIYLPPKERVFHLFNYRQYLKSQKIYWLFDIETITLLAKNETWYWHFKQIIIDRINDLSHSGDYVANFVLNQRNIEDDIMSSYQKNGVVHLLAISGTHIAILILFLRKLKMKDFIIMIFLFFYLFITGFAISLMRAVLFYGLLLLNKFFAWEIKGEKILIFLALALLIYNPFFIYDIGFQFSFVISFFLIHFQSLIIQQKNYFRKAFLVSLIAFLTSLPILVHNFFQFNVLTPFLNLLFVPIFSIVIYPLAIFTFFITSSDFLLAQLIILMETISLFLAQYAIMITIPQLNIFYWLLYYVVIYLFFHFFHYRYFILLIILLTFYKNMAFFNPYGVLTFIDVGQGDAILIETPRQETTILVDTGGVYFPDFRQFLVESRIIPYFKARGITKIDLLVLTHGHYDHLGEAITLLENFPVAQVVLNKGVDNEQEKRIMSYLEKKQIPYQQIAQKKMVINDHDYYFINNKDVNCENEDSLVLYTKLNEHYLLFMGDAGFRSEEYILANYDLNEISVLKVGHHGSRYSSSEEFINTINPDKAIIMAGENNRFNHPHQAVINLFDDKDINYYLTSEKGSIKIILKENLQIFTTKKGND